MDPITGVKPSAASSDATFRKEEHVPAPARSVNGVALRPDAAVPPTQGSAHARSRMRPPHPVQDLSFRQAPARGEDPRDAGPQAQTLRNIEIDPRTRTVLFQAVSSRTGEVVAQVPTEAQLRVREYARTVAEQKAGAHQLAGGRDA